MVPEHLLSARAAEGRQDAAVTNTHRLPSFPSFRSRDGWLMVKHAQWCAGTYSRRWRDKRDLGTGSGLLLPSRTCVPVTKPSTEAAPALHCPQTQSLPLLYVMAPTCLACSLAYNMCLGNIYCGDFNSQNHIFSRVSCLNSWISLSYFNMSMLRQSEFSQCNSFSMIRWNKTHCVINVIFFSVAWLDLNLSLWDFTF